MRSRALGVPGLLLGLALAAALGGCGGDGGGSPLLGGVEERRTTPDRTTTTPPRAPGGGGSGGTAAAKGDRAVIDRWATAMRESRTEDAARVFAPGATVVNGTAITLRGLEDAKVFTASLPCGSRLLETERRRGYVVATFKLTEREGAQCDGPGGVAAVALKIVEGRFTEWLRVPVPGEDEDLGERQEI